MKRGCLYIIFTCFLSITALANNASQFAVQGIKVYKKANSAGLAKEEALKDGQRQGLKVLLKRLNIAEENSKFIGDAELATMVESIQISNEVLTSDSYSSDLKILFSKAFVDYKLKSLKIPNDRVLDSQYLYIPVLQEGKKLDIIGDNIWRSAAIGSINTTKGDNTYVNITILSSEYENAALVNEKIIKNGKYDDFNSLMMSTATNTIAIAIASYDSREDKIEITFREITGDGVKDTKLDFLNVEGLKLDDLMAQASVRTLEFLNNKSKLSVATNSKNYEEIKKSAIGGTMDFYSPIITLQDYIYFKILLSNLPFITKYETVALTNKIAKIRISFAVNEAELISSLKDSGFILTTKNNNNFIVYSGDTGLEEVEY